MNDKHAYVKRICSPKFAQILACKIDKEQYLELRLAHREDHSQGREMAKEQGKEQGPGSWFSSFSTH